MKINLYFGENGTYKTRTLQKIFNKKIRENKVPLSNLPMTGLTGLDANKINTLEEMCSDYYDMWMDCGRDGILLTADARNLVQLPLCIGRILIIDSPESVLTAGQLIIFCKGLLELSNEIEELYLASNNATPLKIFGSTDLEVHYYICDREPEPEEKNVNYFNEYDTFWKWVGV